MPSLFSKFPNPDYVLKLAPEVLGPVLLKMALDQRQAAGFVPESVTQPDASEVINGKDYPYPASDQVKRHVNSAWNWLEREGLIERSAGINGVHGWRDFTPKGLGVAEGQDMQRLLDAAAFPKSLLHPDIREKAWNAIVRSTNTTSQGDLADAVRDAFVTVEDAVRLAGGYDAKDYGDALMKKAFDPDNGPLGDRDTTKPQKERLGLQTLFIGAMNAYRNPVSHRKLAIDLDDAKDRLLLASHLLRIVDARRPKPAS
ncbi:MULTISPECIES: TIGR02391 family protein [unclassified Bradyrhizobium]|uniref:TIGR02391 family protein n=1 Tax=unclassified Bradyrhizobium TaxID=2631580 RepID=UPI002FF403CC